MFVQSASVYQFIVLLEFSPKVNCNVQTNKAILYLFITPRNGVHISEALNLVKIVGWSERSQTKDGSLHSWETIIFGLTCVYRCDVFVTKEAHTRTVNVSNDNYTSKIFESFCVTRSFLTDTLTPVYSSVESVSRWIWPIFIHRDI